MELKKKYKSVVYKRGCVLPQAQAMASFLGGPLLPVHSQIAEESEYFRAYQTLHPHRLSLVRGARRTPLWTAATFG